jgi:hypothetical protein
MLEFTGEQFKKIKNKNEKLYKLFGGVSCPYFEEKVIFNSKGLEHLKFKKKNHARSRNDQYIRLKLLYLAPEVLKLSRTVQGISERKVFELNRSNNRNEYILVDATYYEFIAVLNNVRVRVVVKQVNTGPKYFWSIIPHWKVSNNGNRKMNYGNPEED